MLTETKDLKNIIIIAGNCCFVTSYAVSINPTSPLTTLDTFDLMRFTGCTISLSRLNPFAWRPYYGVIPYVQTVDEILWCDHSNETSSVVLSRGTINLARSSNFGVCGWHPMMLPLKWNLVSRTFVEYYLHVILNDFTKSKFDFFVTFNWPPLVVKSTN